MAAGILLLAWLLTDISLDPMAVLLGLLIGAGAALLIGGAVAAFGGPHGAGKRNSPQGGSAPGPLTEQAD